MQIELRTFEYAKYGVLLKQHYLVLRCNPSIVMGDSKTLLIDLALYSPDEILEHLQKRIYEVDALRYVRLHELPMTIFRANRVDLAFDLTVNRPDITAWLANMSFPYRHRNMTRKSIAKSRDISDFESCYFGSKSRTINAYVKWAEIVNNGRIVPPEEEAILKNTFRIEVQISKKGIYNLRLPTGREIRPFLDENFCHEYIEKEMKSIFGTAPYVSREKALEAIQNSQYRPFDKAVMESIIDTIPRYGGLYELEKAIDDESINTPLQYGSLRTFKSKWLGKFKAIGIQPVVIPDDFRIEKIPSITTLLSRRT